MSDAEAVELLCGADMTCLSDTTGYMCGESYDMDKSRPRSECEGQLVRYTRSPLRVRSTWFLVVNNKATGAGAL